MKICILSPTSTKIELGNWKQPLGGADKALLVMMESCGLNGNEVHSFIPIDNRQQLASKQFAYPYMDIFKEKIECDVLIVYRKAWAIPNNIKYKKLLFYTQDLTDTPAFNGAKSKDYFKIYDGAIVLSTFHQINFLETFDYPPEKMFILGNASNEYEKVDKEPLSFIYMSTPYRGLVVLMKMWKKIIEMYPTAKLHVYSSMKIYGKENLDDLQFSNIYDGLKRMKGVVSHGSVSHDEVIKQLQKSFLLLYPNTYPETYCNVLMESRACHTPFITSDNGALPETGGNAGLYVKGNPYSEEYQTEFLSKLVALISYDKLYSELQNNCYPIRQWENYNFDLQKILGECEAR